MKFKMIHENYNVSDSNSIPLNSITRPLDSGNEVRRKDYR